MLFFSNSWDRLNWPCQRVSAPQWPPIDTFPLDSPNLPCASGGAPVGRWRKVLSRAFKTAAVADAGADPIRFYPVVCPPLVLLRPSSWWKAGRQVGVTISQRGAIRRFAQQRSVLPSSTTWCASVAAARWHIGLNPMDDLRPTSATAHACTWSSTLHTLMCTHTAHSNIIPTAGAAPPPMRGGVEVRLLSGRRADDYFVGASEGAHTPRKLELGSRSALFRPSWHALTVPSWPRRCRRAARERRQRRRPDGVRRGRRRCRHCRHRPLIRRPPRWLSRGA